MSLIVENLKKERTLLCARKEEMQQMFYQLMGAISILDQLINAEEDNSTKAPESGDINDDKGATA